MTLGPNTQADIGAVIDGAERPLCAFSLPISSEVFAQGWTDLEPILAQLEPARVDKLVKSLKEGAAVHRIGGICTTAARDRKGERITHTALNFAPFLAYGAFNDNHSPLTAHVVGAPIEAFAIPEGWKSPGGRLAKGPSHWTSGVMYSDPHSRQLYEKAKAMEEVGLREMGMSVQGNILVRAADDRSTILRGDVLEVAITHIPTNGETSFEELAKSMLAQHAGIQTPAPERLDEDDLAKLIQKSRPRFSGEKARAFASVLIRLAQGVK